MREKPTLDVRMISGATRFVVHRWRWLALLFVMLFAAKVAADGFYTIRPESIGIRKIFGKVAEQPLESGLHWKWPRFIERVLILEAHVVSRLDIDPPPGQSLSFLTADENIVEIKAHVQHQVKDMTDYLIRTERAEQILKLTAETILFEMTAVHNVDMMLTGEKARLQRQGRLLLQQRVDEYGLGIRVLSFNLTTVEPPQRVREAFRRAFTAQAESAKAVSQARGKQRQRESAARSQAMQVSTEAKRYEQEQLSGAEGRIGRYQSMLVEYKLDRELIRSTLYLDAMSRVLPRLRKIMIPAATENAAVHFHVPEPKR
jgi:modulator of FtsH protease HflK